VEHIFYETEDSDAPEEIKDQNGEVCLGMCKICRCAEGTLPTNCPGYPIGFDAEKEIYKGILDFIGNEWVRKEAR
jgi:hypothetical protein